jgi:hypothetical protein
MMLFSTAFNASVTSFLATVTGRHTPCPAREKPLDFLSTASTTDTVGMRVRLLAPPGDKARGFGDGGVGVDALVFDTSSEVIIDLGTGAASVGGGS